MKNGISVTVGPGNFHITATFLRVKKAESICKWKSFPKLSKSHKLYGSGQMKLCAFRGYKRKSSKPSTDLGRICLHNIVRTLCCAVFVLHDLPFREIKLVDPRLCFCMLLTWRTWMYKPAGTGQVWLSFDVYLHTTVRVIPNNTIYVQKTICNVLYNLAYTIHVDVPSA
jgi:hypothetical protein